VFPVSETTFIFAA